MEKNVLTEQEKKEIKGLILPEEVIEKVTALGWDGSNIMIRLPKDIANYLKIDKKNRFEKAILFKIKESQGKVEKTFEILKRTKLKRKRKK